MVTPAEQRLTNQLPQSPRQLVIFLHIPRTGGTTLWSIIRRQYGPKYYARYQWRDLNRNVAALEQRLHDDPQTLRLTGGHVPYGVHRATGRPVVYFTLLRDPIQWTISSYYKFRRKQDHPLHARFAELDNDINACIPLLEDNLQTRMIAGLTDSGACTREHLEIAKARLRDEMRVTGLLERYDETLILLRRAFGWKMPYYFLKNIGGNSRSQREHPPETLEIARQQCALDLELYAYAQQLFDAQVRQQGITFAQEVRLFRVLNPLAERWLRFERRMQGKPVRNIKQ